MFRPFLSTHIVMAGTLLAFTSASLQTLCQTPTAKIPPAKASAPPPVPAPPPVAGISASGSDGSVTLALHKTSIPATSTVGDLIDLYGVAANDVACTRITEASCPQYIIVNIVDWSDPTSPKSSWALIHSKQMRASSLSDAVIDSGLRIYGSKSVGLLAVHSDVPATGITYTVTFTKKQSTQVGDLLALLKIIGVAAKPAVAQAWVGARALEIPSTPDDIAISGQVSVADTKTSASIAAQTFTKTYDNEGLSHWDVSAAIPVTGLKSVQYSSDGTVTAKNISKATAYGMFHYYPLPVDLKGAYPWTPSIVAGLALTGQPLNKPFVGLSTGLHKPFPITVNFFAGAVFNKVFAPSTLKVGSSASSSQLQSNLASHRVTKLMFGVDIPITQFVKAIASSTTKNATK